MPLPASKHLEIESSTGSSSMNLMDLQSKVMTLDYKPLEDVQFLGICFVRRENLQLSHMSLLITACWLMLLFITVTRSISRYSSSLKNYYIDSTLCRVTIVTSDYRVLLLCLIISIFLFGQQGNTRRCHWDSIGCQMV